MERKNKKSLFKPLALAAALAMGAGLAACSSSSSVDETAVGPVLGEAGQPKGKFVGSATCKQCHQGEHNGWSETVHGDMIQVASKESMAPWAREQFEYYLANDPDSQYLGIGSEGGRGQLEKIEDIKYVVGGKWKQRYVVKSDEGHVFLRYQYYWSKADGSHDHWSEGDDRDDRFNDYGGNRVYEDRCLDCHSTGFDLELANSLDRTAENYTLGSIVSELGIGCEKCHGPGKDHVASVSAADILNPADFTKEQQVQFCGSCHGRNAAHATIDGREDAFGFELGDTNLHEVVKMLDVTVVNGGNVLHNPGVGYFAGTSQRFYDDGASRSHRQQYNDFIQSPHYGKLSCTSCHNVHAGNTLKAASPAALCATCHDGSIAPGRMFTPQDIDTIMPKRARSSNQPDITTHTFLYGGIGKAAPGIPRNDAGKSTLESAKEQVTEAAYIGSQMCQHCHPSHQNAHAGWVETAHGSMVQKVDHTSDATRALTIRPKALEMLNQAVATDGSQNDVVTHSGSDQWAEIIPGWAEMDPKKVTYADLAIYSRSKDPAESGTITDLKQIKYTVGGEWKQRYVVWMPNEGHVFLRWQFYDSGELGPRAHSYDEKRVYEDRCLACHSTGFDLAAVPEERDVEYNLGIMVAELGIGCESCHGPGSLHWDNIFSNKEKGLAAIINPAQFKASEQFDACGSCHARNDGWLGNADHGTDRNDAPGFLIGDDLNDHVKVTRWPNEKRFHADGAGSSHRMQYNDMEQGPKAGMSCSTCHDVHKADALKMDFEALCASCHGPNHGYDIDKVMPKRAKSTDVPDIRTHTFIIGPDGTAVGNQ